jgi:hypothetical protein
MIVASCARQSITVKIDNPFDIARHNTTVEVAWADVAAGLPSVDPLKVVVTCAESGEELPSQVVYHGQPTPQLLIFQVSLEARTSAAFLIKKGDPQPYTAKTYGRYIPERKDDFGWENDRVVFRMYGPALAKENPSNGVDLWLKKTEKLIIDQFYNDDLKNGKSYHVDHGEGLDCYKVGHALGAGGIAPYLNDTLWVGSHYTTQEVWDNGPLRTTFKLTYNNLPVGKKTFSEELVISLDGGSQFNRAVVSFDGDFTNMQAAAGIFLHEPDNGQEGITVVDDDRQIPNSKTSEADGYIAYGEAAVSDAGIPAGRNYVGVILPDGVTECIRKTGHLLALAPYAKGEKLTYYFGGGWDQWGFANDDAWFDHVAAFAQRLKNPLTVVIQ